MSQLNTQKGFTLIELLVVVAIIGMLSSVVLAALNDARAQAQNTSRLNTIKQYMTALELYRDQSGGYPLTGSTWVCLGDYADGGCWNANSYSESAALEAALTPYIQLHNGTADFAYSSYEGMLYYCGWDLGGGACGQYQMLWWMTGEGEDCGPRAVELNPGSYNNATYCNAVVNLFSS